MTPEQRRRVRDLFEAALERAGEVDWIAHQAADDPEVRDEVLSLVDHHSKAGDFLSRPIADEAPDLLADDEGLVPGAVVGSYTIVRELGRGGMGRVYLATDARLGRTVALKALAPHLLRDPAQRERLRREARSAAALSHPGICTVYALDDVDGVLYLATEYLDGMTLGDEIRSGDRPAPAELLRTARELASALASAHAAGIVHRDLKPDNVMRTRDGRLKILDFGLARMVEDSAAARETVDAGGAKIGSGAKRGSPAAGTFATRPGVIVGTPAYMAPEQINGQPADARVDIFALGVLLYEYSCGEHPFIAGTELATVARVVGSEPAPLGARCPDVPAPLAAVITRCLKKTPAERFGSAMELVGALDVVGSSSAVPGGSATAWRVHQIVIIVLYVIASAWAWRIKAWMENPVTVGIFLALGAISTINGVLRGHLVFTELMNRALLTAERLRTGWAMLALDLLTGLLLFVDGIVLAGTRALPSVLTIGLALGIVLAAVVLEPATTKAAFEEDA